MDKMLKMFCVILLLTLSFGTEWHVEITAGMEFSPSTLTVSVGSL